MLLNKLFGVSLLSKGVFFSLATLCLSHTGNALAQSPEAEQNYPSRAVKIIAPFAPGGVTDIVARYLASKLAESTSQAFIDENRTGASGNIALEAAVKSVPDGYTLFVGNVTTNAINKNGNGNVKPSRDLVGITELAEIPHVLAASSDSQVNTVAETIDYLKKTPGKVNYASAGIGSYPHLDMLKFARITNNNIVHIPYKNCAAGMVPSLMANETQLAFVNLASTNEQIKAGKIKAITTTAPAPLAEMPNVPTMAELDYQGIETNAWQGIFAPTATPKLIVDKLYNLIAKVMFTPEIKERMSKEMMMIVLFNSPQVWTDQVKLETGKWAEFISENKIKFE